MVRADFNLHNSIFLFVFVPLCIVYSIACNWVFPQTPLLYNYMNIGDHQFYVSTIEQIIDGNLLLSVINNDVGISLIYISISYFFSLIGINDIILVAFIFNLGTLFLVYKLYIKICNKLGLIGITKYLFFLGLQFLYFTQLINKDLLTILFFLLVLNCLLNKQFRWIFFLSIIFFFVRIQLFIFGVLCIYLSFGNIRTRLLISYVVTSLFAGFASVNNPIISSESIGEGFSGIVIAANQKYYYIGNLILNPVRVLQFILDIYYSFYIFFEGLIDVAKVLRLPLLLVLLFHVKPIYQSFSYFKTFQRTSVSNVQLIILAFLLTWLINPTVNARYIMLIVPFLLILARFVQLNKNLMVKDIVVPPKQ